MQFKNASPYFFCLSSPTPEMVRNSCEVVGNSDAIWWRDLSPKMM